MEQFNFFKRAYYGYFLSSIRVDLYNKILLHAVIENKLSYTYDALNLENNLKNELFKSENKHYFNKYFEMRLEFYNSHFSKYDYDLETTINLIYEYRNFLLDDTSRLDVTKFKYIFNKTLEEKEKDIQSIILLLLSEYVLEEYGKSLPDSKRIFEYERYYFSQNSKVISYRKYVSKYFGVSKYTNKIIYLNRKLSDVDISLSKRYQLVIQLYNNMMKDFEVEKNVLIDLDIIITKDYLSENDGLLEIPVNKYLDKNILLNFSQLFLLYLLRKREEKYNFFNFLKFLKNKTNMKLKNGKYVVKSLYIYEFSYDYMHKLIENRHVKKYIRNYNLKSSRDLVKLIYIKKLYNKGGVNIRQFISKRDFIDEFLCVEFLGSSFNGDSLKGSIKSYLKDETENKKNLQKQIFGILNQIKFTMNGKDLAKIYALSGENLYEFEKEFKKSKKYLVPTYIDTMFILILFRIHKYNNNEKYKEAYIYRNNIMHFQKNLFYDDEIKQKILSELNILKSKHKYDGIEISFSNKFFNLLKYDDENGILKNKRN